MKIGYQRLYIRSALFHKPNGKAQRREADLTGIVKGVRHQAQKPSTTSLHRGVSYDDVLMDAARNRISILAIKDLTTCYWGKLGRIRYNGSLDARSEW